MLDRSGVPVLGVQHEATVWDEPGHLALKISRDDAVLLAADDQGGAGDVWKDRSVVELREAVKQAQESLRAPWRRNEAQEWSQGPIAISRRRSMIQRGHAPVQLRPVLVMREIPPGLEN